MSIVNHISFPLLENNPCAEYVFGVDGCSGGWVVVAIQAYGEITHCDVFIIQHFSQIVPSPSSQSETNLKAIMIDMPIGLLEYGRRPCEKLARQLIAPRTSSVFAAPRRPMLTMETYQNANEWGKRQGVEGGGGLSKQAFNLFPKIKEIDAIITPNHQSFISEAHPELAFTRLNKGIACTHNKRHQEGILQRQNLLMDHTLPNPRDLFTHLKQTQKTSESQKPSEIQKSSEKLGKATLDDVMDAMALALTARARLSKNAIHLTDGTRDQKGLLLEIWG